MPILPVESIEDPRLSDFRDVGDHDRLRERGLFVAESRIVVSDLLSNARFRTRSLLLTRTSLERMRLADCRHDLPVYVGSPALMASIVGYHVHRGCLAIGERPSHALDEDWLAVARTARLVVVLEDVGNPDNIGGVFRNAAAFGVPLVVVSPRCGDPLYRKAIRVSIGATLRLPFAEVTDWPGGLERLRSIGLSLVALTPDPTAVDIDHFADRASGRLAVLLGSEGTGLTAAALQLADARVRIPMAPGTDSLNMSAAVAIALHRLARLGSA